MKPLGSITIRRDAETHERIGPLKRNVKASSAIELEDLVFKLSPLPTTYDVAPLQPAYFSEFTYFDCVGGLFVATLNEEINARVVQHSIEDVRADDKVMVNFLAALHDKYAMKKPSADEMPRKIVFYPGSNMLHVVDLGKVDRYLFENPDALIKPHPIMTDEGLRMIASRFGYHRIIDPKESGMEYLKWCDEICYTSNSEIGLVAAFLGIPAYEVTREEFKPRLSYATIYKMFKDGNTTLNRQIASRVLASPKSGMVMPWHDDKEERLTEYFKFAMMFREVFKPYWPWNDKIPPLKGWPRPPELRNEK